MKTRNQKCPFCGKEFRRRLRRHMENCHMQPGRDRMQPIHFTDLVKLPFTIKSPYGKG